MDLAGSTISEQSVTLDSDFTFTQNRFLGSIGAPIDLSWWSSHFEKDEEATDYEIPKEEDDNTGASCDRTSTLVPVVSGLALFFFFVTIPILIPITRFTLGKAMET